MRTSLKLLAGSMVLAACSADSTMSSPASPDEPLLAAGSFLPQPGLITRYAELEYLEVCKDYVMRTQAAPPPFTEFSVDGPGAPAGAKFYLAPGACRDVWLIGADGEHVTVTETVPDGFTASSVRYLNTDGVPSSIGGTTNSTTSFISGANGGTGELVVFTNTEEVRGSGCTLTQGYWKTHSTYGPASKPDAGWFTTATPQGPDTPFYTSGQTWYQLFHTPPKGGNVYIQLAHQYMASRLNILNGASTTAAVDAAITAAESFFGSVTGPSSTLTTQQRDAARAAAATLGSYNEGLIGPGHCD